MPIRLGWKRIVENLAVVVAELERTFAAEIEAATGTTSEWFEPPSMGGI